MTRNPLMFAGAVTALLTLLLHAVAPARAELRIDITRGKVEPMPIAIPSFSGAGNDESQAGREIAGVVAADLERSGLFRPLDPQSFIQNVSATDAQPRFGDWRQIGAQVLGPHFGEARLLNAVHMFQRETDWHLRAPAGHAAGFAP